MKTQCMIVMALALIGLLCSHVTAAPDCTATGDLGNVCAGTAGLSASVPAGPSGTTYLWSISANGTITGPNDQPSVTYSADSAGLLTLTVQVTDPLMEQCQEDYPFTVYANPTANILSGGVPSDYEQLCPGDSTVLNGNPSAGSGVITSHQWTGDTGPLTATNIQSPTFTTTTQGVYSLVYTVTDSNGCYAVDTIEVEVANPVVDILVNGTSASAFETCAGVTVNLNGNPSGGFGNYSHLWVGSNLNNYTIQSPTFSTSVTGVYSLTYTVTDGAGCTASDSLSITVHPNPSTDILINGFPLSSEWLCINESVNLDGNPSGGSNIFVTHRWTGSGASRLNDPNIQTPVFQSAVAGNYSLTYRVIDSRGCTRTDSITIRVANPIPSIEANGYQADTYTACSGDGLILNGNPRNGSYIYVSHTWTGDIGPLDRTDIQAPIFNTSATGTYSLLYTVVDSQGCIGSDSITITVISNPVANAGPDNLVLFGESVMLDASGSNCSGGCTYFWEVVSGDMNSIDEGSTSVECTVSPESASVYQVTVTDAAGCTDTDTVVITVGAIPIPAMTITGIGLLLVLLGGSMRWFIRNGRIRSQTITLSVLAVLAAFLVTSGASAQTVRFVDAASTSPASPYGTWQTAGHTIQTVINASDPGDTIFVADGVYIENVSMNEDIDLISWCLDPESCIIQASNSSAPALTMADPAPNSNQMVLAGFRFQGGTHGVYLTGNMGASQIPLIRNCIIDGYTGAGIHCMNGVFAVEFCTIANNSVGIFANDTDSRSSSFFNIISGNSSYGIEIDASYFLMRDNCFFDNGSHLFGAPNAYCDEWSLLALPDGVDPMFLPGSFRLDPLSPCRDFSQNTPYTACNENRFDQDESPFDLGAYGGYGSWPLSPYIDTAYLDPEPGDFKIPPDAPVSFRIEDDGTAGIDLSTLRITIQNHGHPLETFTQSSLVISPIPQYGSPPDDCLAKGYDVTLPGPLHGLYDDFAYVRATVSVSDRSPNPNSVMYNWEFHADDLNPPILLTGFYPGQGAVNVPVYGPIQMDLYDAGVGIDPESMFLTLNGDPLSLNLSEITWTGTHLTIIPRPRFVEGQPNTLTFTISDFYGNTMPTQTISFTCSADTDLPFVPGVTGPSWSPGMPQLAPGPIPAPGSSDSDASNPITFHFQDLSTIVNLMDMQVQIQSGSSTYRYYLEPHGGSTRQFQASGDPQARMITCNPVGVWPIGSTITVTITGGTDTAATPNTMSTAIYTFTCASAPLPATSTWSLAILLAGFGILIFIRRR